MMPAPASTAAGFRRRLQFGLGCALNLAGAAILLFDPARVL